jgi:uncharacterized protein YutE (UPF0331/DUF86 family)
MVMNERIRELATEVGMSVEYLESTKQIVLIERFAELIVQECIDIISPYTVRMSRPGEEYLHPINEIKKHFGVEL